MSRFLDDRYLPLEPYVPGEQPQDKKYIKLNTNESPFPPSPLAQKAAAEEARRLNLYPDPAAGLLLKPLAEMLGVGQQNVFAGNGSDEILAFIFQALCPKGATFADLTYGFYKVYAALYGVQAQVVPLRQDFSLNPQDYAAAGKTIFIANPNAPTGLALTAAQIEGIVKANPESLVVVDEAYVHFGAETVVPLTTRYPNLLVVGTFSKSRALAGGRLGYAAGDAALIEDLDRIKFSFNPYNLNRMTMAAGAASIADVDYYESCRAKIVATRARCTGALRQMGFECTDSLANFIFATRPGYSGESLYKSLKDKGILVRWWNSPRIKDHLRITVGTDEEMDALLAALKEIVNQTT